MKAAFLGPEGTFSHIAAKNAFPAAKLVPAETIDDVFKLVEKGAADVGVVPIENSLEGSVNATLDLLLGNDLQITGEQQLRVVHNLLAKKGVKLANVKVIMAHPQALAQCKGFLARRFSDAEKREVSSNAKACILLDDKSAAIASELAAKIYGLDALEKGIQDSEDNFTRFVFVSKEKKPGKPTGKDKTSLAFWLEDKPGTLLNALRIFGDRGINLTKIESRPSRKKSWEYVFFVDLEGHAQDEKTKEALEALGKSVAEVRLLGSYPKAK